MRYANDVAILLVVVLAAVARVVEASEVSKLTQPLKQRFARGRHQRLRKIVSSVTLQTQTFGLILSAGLVFGIIFALSFQCIWITYVQDRRGRRPTNSARESLVRNPEYISRQDSTNSCAIM